MVLVKLVVEDVRIRKVGVQRVDDLFGFLFVEPDGIVTDGACFLANGLLGAHCTP
jgi:hypothetical protein